MQTPEQNNPRSPEVKTAKEPRVSHLQGCLGICFMLSYWPRAEDWVRGLPATVAPTTCPDLEASCPLQKEGYYHQLLMGSEILG